MANSFDSQQTFSLGDRSFTIYRLDAVEKKHSAASRLPFSLKILLENLLRYEDDLTVTASDIEALANWDAKATPSQEIAFRPSRVLLQDFTGVPAIVDLAAMRDAMVKMGGDPKKINPLQPAELVIDHSVQVDYFGDTLSLKRNTEIEFDRNRERYGFLRWGQEAFDNFKVVPPGTGIVHQVNLEYLARVVFENDSTSPPAAYPDTLVGTDSHTTMINGLGVLGWGVGGIEAEAAMLGQPISMLIPQVVGFKLSGRLPEGSTATDLVLRVVEMLRQKGVVGKFVEFYGEGLADLPLADRATIANMAPEYGATCGIFPIDARTLDYLSFSGRAEAQVQLVEAYAKEQGMFHTKDTPEAVYSGTMELDLNTIEPSLAGPKNPQDRVPLSNAKSAFATALPELAGKDPDLTKEVSVQLNGHTDSLHHGSVVIAAITSCTNTSNPSVMMAAGLVAKKAVEKGLKTQPWVKTSLAPGSKVVTDYLNDSGLMEYLDKLRFNLVGYGCTTCIGNSGPLPESVGNAIRQNKLVACSVLSGNRNFEGRVHADVRANYLASPPLVVAYALAGRMDIDLQNEPLGTNDKGEDVYLKDVWPTQEEIQQVIGKSVRKEMYETQYASVYEGDDEWKSLPVPKGDQYVWDPTSTYVKHPPYFEGMKAEPDAVQDIVGARVLLKLGDKVTTDHISPAGAIQPSSPAGLYLQSLGVQPGDFNSYGSRRGNHEIMMRGTFANVRIRNQIAPGTEGGVTRLLPEGREMPVYDAAMEYQKQGVPTIVLAGGLYGSGSSRDWAAKGPCLLGVRAVIAESFERIHRSNLVGMGVLPLEFLEGESADKLGLTGEEVFDIKGIPALIDGAKTHSQLTVSAKSSDGTAKEFKVTVRIDTPQEIAYYRHRGILSYALRRLLQS